MSITYNMICMFHTLGTQRLTKRSSQYLHLKTTLNNAYWHNENNSPHKKFCLLDLHVVPYRFASRPYRFRMLFNARENQSANRLFLTKWKQKYTTIEKHEQKYLKRELENTEINKEGQKWRMISSSSSVPLCHQWLIIGQLWIRTAQSTVTHPGIWPKHIKLLSNNTCSRKYSW